MIKLIHMITAVISICGFIYRGVLMIRQSPKLQQRWIKITPHINDTILLVSALMLAYQIQQYPFVVNWLSAKVIALILYIVLGLVAFRFARNMYWKITAWILAQVVFLYIVAVAMTRNALVF